MRKLIIGLWFALICVGTAVAASVYTGSLVLPTSGTTISTSTNVPLQLVANGGTAVPYPIVMTTPHGCGSSGMINGQTFIIGCNGGYVTTSGTIVGAFVQGLNLTPTDFVCAGMLGVLQTSPCPSIAPQVTPSPTGAGNIVWSGSYPYTSTVATPSPGAAGNIAWSSTWPYLATVATPSPAATGCPHFTGSWPYTINGTTCFDTTTALQTITVEKSFAAFTELYFAHGAGSGITGGGGGAMYISSGASEPNFAVSPQATAQANEGVIWRAAISSDTAAIGPLVVYRDTGLTPGTAYSPTPQWYVDYTYQTHTSGVLSNGSRCTGASPQTGLFTCRVQLDGGSPSHAEFDFTNVYNSAPACVVSAESRQGDITAVNPTVGHCIVTSGNGDTDWVTFIVMGNPR